MPQGRPVSSASSCPSLNLEVALQTMHRLGLEDGDIGYAYWHQVAELLQSAAAMRARLEELEQVHSLGPAKRAATSSGESAQASSGPEDAAMEKARQRADSPQAQAGVETEDDLVHGLGPSTSNALRLEVAFESAQSHLDELAEIVAKSQVEVVLRRTDRLDVALVGSERFAQFKAMEAHATLIEPSEGMSQVIPGHAFAKAHAEGEEQLAISVDYFVLDSTVSPRQTLERYRLECELLVGDEPFDIEIRVGDDQSRETHLATWRNFAWGGMSLSAVVLRCLYCALLGTPEPPHLDAGPAEPFNEVVLAIHERSASVRAEPLLLLAACRRHTVWVVHWSRAYVAEGAQTWLPETAVDSLHPLKLIWQVAEMLDGPVGPAPRPLNHP